MVYVVCRHHHSMNFWITFCCIQPFRDRRAAVAVKASSQQSKNLEPEPARITSNVKRSLLYLKSRKKEKQGVPRPTTAYRKKKLEKENFLDDDELFDDPTTKLYFTSHVFELARPVLLVDGYNMCGYWPKLKKHFTKGHLENARQKLLEELVTFTVIKDVKVVVVFDAVLSGKPSHKDMFQGIDIIYSAGTSADIWIEREVTLLKKDGCPQVWVATSDLVHQQCASAVGAFVWSCKMLLAQIKDAKKERDQIVNEKRSFSMQGKLLEHNIDPQVIDALKDLKKRMHQPRTNQKEEDASH